MVKKMTPSRDWSVGFSDLRTISPVTETFYNRTVIHSWEWDQWKRHVWRWIGIWIRKFPWLAPLMTKNKNTVPPKGQF